MRSWREPVLSRLRTINRWLVTVESAVAAALVLAIFLVVLLQIAMRYVFERPNPWSEEVSRLCFIWLSMLGASLAVQHRTHFAFDQVIERLQASRRLLARRLTAGLIGTSALALMVLGIELVNLARYERSAALNLPVAWVYVSVPVASCLMLVHLIATIGVPRENDR